MYLNIVNTYTPVFRYVLKFSARHIDIVNVDWWWLFTTSVMVFECIYAAAQAFQFSLCFYSVFVQRIQKNIGKAVIISGKVFYRNSGRDNW